MEILENYVEEQENLEIKNSVLKNISKDFSSIAWVTIVFMLIICSYIQTEAGMPKNAKLDMYELSIAELDNSVEL